MKINNINSFNTNNYYLQNKNSSKSENKLSFTSYKIYLTDTIVSENKFLDFMKKNDKILKLLSKEELIKIKELFYKFEEEFISSKLPIELLIKDKNFNFEALELLLERFKKEKIPYSYLDTLFVNNKVQFICPDPTYICTEPKEKVGDYKEINYLLDFRVKALQNRHLLDRHNSKTTIKEINELLLKMPYATLNTLKILGEHAFIYSFKEKIDNVINYITELGLKQMNPEVTQTLTKFTNLDENREYNELVQKITELKNKFPTTPPNMIEDLKSKINTATHKKNTLFKNALKDPKDILEFSLIIATLEHNGLHKEALEVFTIQESQDVNKKKALYSYLNKQIFNIYKIDTPSEEVCKLFNFSNSKYLPKLFYANDEFKQDFSKLVKDINDSPTKDLKSYFNELPSNKETKDAFEKLGLNYEKWSTYNPALKIEIEISPNNKLKIQKVDMNNIVHSIFLGEHACCCTKINGAFACSAISYIKSKMFQAIEVYHNEEPIGNTMCYIATINGVPCLMLDNIEVKPQYENDDVIRDGIINYAKKIAEEIGAPEMPIFLAGTRNDINSSPYEKKYYKVNIIGSSEEQVYLDALTMAIAINDVTRNLHTMLLRRTTENTPTPSIEIEKLNIPNLTEQEVNLYIREVYIDPNYD